MSIDSTDGALRSSRLVRVEAIVPAQDLPEVMSIEAFAAWLGSTSELTSLSLCVEEADVTAAESEALDAEVELDAALADSEGEAPEQAEVEVTEPGTDNASDSDVIELDDVSGDLTALPDEELDSDALVDEVLVDEPVSTEAEAAAPPSAHEPERRVLTLHRTLRSGAVVRFDGDIVIHGDLNPGAQVIAAGNVLVLGHLKGLAHAGCTGDESATILGFDLRPTQLRIARHIAIPPERDAHAGLFPEIARVDGEQIAIEPYRTRSPRQVGA